MIIIVLIKSVDEYESRLQLQPPCRDGDRVIRYIDEACGSNAVICITKLKLK